MKFQLTITNFSLSNLNLIHVILMIPMHDVKCVWYYIVFTWWQWGTSVSGILFCYSPGHRYYIIIQIIHSKCHYTHYNTLYRQNWLHKPFLPHWQYLDTGGCLAQSQHFYTQFVIAIWQRRAAGVKTGNRFIEQNAVGKLAKGPLCLKLPT